MTSASVVRLSLGFVASIVIARSLGPAAFGVYAILGIVASIGGAVADLGITTAAVKRVAEAWRSDQFGARERAGAYLWLRGGTALLFVVGATGLIGLLSLVRPLPLPSPWLLPLTYLGVGATALSAAISALLQASGAFGAYALVLLTNAGLTAILALLLGATNHLTLVTALLILGSGTALVALVVGWRLLPASLRPGRLGLESLHLEWTALLRVGRWIWLANVLAMLTAQLDVVLVRHWNDAAAVGAYALALNLASKVDIANQNLYTVLLPAAATLQGPNASRTYLTRGLLRGGLISLALLPLVPLAGVVIPLVYGPSYAPAVGLFRLLLGVAIVDLLTTPLLALPYRHDGVKLLAAADAIRALTMLVAGSRLIPALGPSGAVAARLVAKAAGASVVAIGLRMREDRISRRPALRRTIEQDVAGRADLHEQVHMPDVAAQEQHVLLDRRAVQERVEQQLAPTPPLTADLVRTEARPRNG